ncbi:MAG: hypothetical protein ACO1RX_23245 [Candidatus Sericytochromatia bacterium]
MPSIGHSALYPLPPQGLRSPQQLAPPGQIFRAVAPQIPRSPGGPRPVFNQVSALLQAQDQLQMPIGQRSQPALLPLFGGRSTVTVSARMQQHQQKIVESGLKEWRAGVRESGGSNRGPRIDAYARNAKFGPGYEWCGFFAAFNYTQTGFKYPEHFASYQKARDFFLYRSYTSRSPALHQELDQLRQQQQAQGSTRQYMIMAESPTFDYVRNYKSYYGHVDLASMTHTWRNIPIQPGDIALFSHGHVGQVISYDRQTGRLETVEGNTAGTGPDGKYRTQAVVRKSYDLSKAADRQRFDGFGRAALGDFA